MRVIQLVDKLGPSGGVPSFVYDLCFALKDAGCDITLIGILNNKSDKKAPYRNRKKARGYGISQLVRSTFFGNISHPLSVA